MAAVNRERPNILVTGTPGTGKTTLAATFAENTNYEHLNVAEIIKQNDFYEGYDNEFQCHVLDEDKLLDHIEDRLLDPSGGCIVDYHSAELFAERWFDVVIVLRTNNTVLFDRLTKRGYNQTKLTNNIDAEIFGTILEEAQQAYKNELVFERQSDNPEQMQDTVDWLQYMTEIYVVPRFIPINPRGFFQDKMCRLWNHIRHSAQWMPDRIIQSYMKTLSLQNVSAVKITMDPFHTSNASIRQMWQALSSIPVKQTNLQCAIDVQLTNDRKPPVLTAKRTDGLTLIYKTERLSFIDLLQYFTKHTTVDSPVKEPSAAGKKKK